MLMTTSVIVKIDEKEYAFEGSDIDDALSKVKYSRVPFKLLRRMGVRWTKRIMWPTFKLLQDRSFGLGSVSVQLPNTVTSILRDRSDGELQASVDMSLDYDDFNANATATFSSDKIEIGFDGQIDEPEQTGNALRDVFKMLSTYNIDVDEVELDVQSNESPKNATVTVDTNVPKEIRKTKLSSR